MPDGQEKGLQLDVMVLAFFSKKILWPFFCSCFLLCFFYLRFFAPAYFFWLFIWSHFSEELPACAGIFGVFRIFGGNIFLENFVFKYNGLKLLRT